MDINIKSYGNPFFIPSLVGLWKYQTGYRLHGQTGEPNADWQDDWLAVADEAEGVFIFSRASGEILHDLHGRGVWEPAQLFPDLQTMAACLGQLGAIVASAGDQFTDKECCIRPKYRAQSLADLRQLLGSQSAAEHVLTALGWG